MLNIFANFICLYFIYCMDINEFPQELNRANLISVHKKEKKW